MIHQNNMPIPDTDIRVGRIYKNGNQTVRVVHWDGRHVLVKGPKTFSPQRRIETCYLQPADPASVQFFISHMPL